MMAFDQLQGGSAQINVTNGWSEEQDGRAASISNIT